MYSFILRVSPKGQTRANGGQPGGRQTEGDKPQKDCKLNRRRSLTQRRVERLRLHRGE